jgi:hypothetical protein
MTEAPRATTGERLFRIFLVAVFLVMAVELYLLAKQNRALDGLVESLRTQIDVAQKMSQPPLPAGEIVAPLEVTSLTGEKTMLAYDEDRTTVLFFFSPNCPACEANVARWKRIESASGRGTLGLDLDHARGQTSPTLRIIGSRPARRHEPSDLAPSCVPRAGHDGVGKGGVVRNAWAGLLSDEAIAIASGARS